MSGPGGPTLVHSEVHQSGGTTVIDREYHQTFDGAPGELEAFGIREQTI